MLHAETVAGCPETAGLNVPTHVRREIRHLSRLRPWRAMAAVAGDWLIIVGCFLAVHWWPHPLVWVAAICIVATRQHAFAVLVHEAAHYRLLRDRTWNNRVSDWFLAFPVLTTTDGYRRHHLAHHMYFNTDRDPDFVRKQGRDWEFPKTGAELARLLFRDLLGWGFLSMIRAVREFRRAAADNAAAQSSSAKFGRLLYYVLVATAVTLAGLWPTVLLLWLLPMVTVFPLLMHIRSIAEHSAVPGEHDFNMSRTVQGPWWERFLFVPHNVSYHLDHHLFPSVPFYHLPKLHEHLLTWDDFATLAHRNDSFLAPSGRSVLSDLLRQPDEEVAATSWPVDRSHGRRTQHAEFQEMEEASR